MRKSFITILIIGLILSFPQVGFSQNQKLKIVKDLVLVDSKGRIVGYADFEDPGAVVGVRVLFVWEGQVVYVSAHSGGFNSLDRLAFESVDCSGPPLTRNIEAFLAFRGLIGPPGRTLYVQEPGAAPTTLTVRSEWAETSCIPRVDSFPVAPTIPLVRLDKEFTPPFRLRSIP